MLALCDCGEGALESVTTINALCTDEARLAILVEVSNPDDVAIDSVKATHAREQPCYLESAPLGSVLDDAGASDAALYSCWEQGAGSYVVRVTSGKRSWTQSVDVPGDDCHVTKAQKLLLELE